MATISFSEQVQRFISNEDRANTFVNGGVDDTWTSSGGAVVPSLQKLVADSQVEIASLVAGQLQSYSILRAYRGNSSKVQITDNNTYGVFYRDNTDNVSQDNGGTIIVDVLSRRWKRIFDGAIDVKWFGAVGNRVGNSGFDDTLAIANALNAAIAGPRSVLFSPGSYGVVSITFPLGQLDITFDRAELVGIATAPTDCIVKMLSEGTRVKNMTINMAWNTNYKCGLWWYNSTASSQLNTITSLRIIYGVRGVVYGEFPGQTSTLFAQSENTIIGFTTRGVQNPWYGNHGNGFMYMVSPMFSCNDEEWALRPAGTPAFNWVDGRALENIKGQLTVVGGSVQKAGVPGGFGADIALTRFLGTTFEVVAPLRIVGDGVGFTSRSYVSVTKDSIPQFVLAAGLSNTTTTFNDSDASRAVGVGSYDGSSFFDATGAGLDNTLEIINSRLKEWKNDHISNNTPLVKNARVVLRNVSIQVTAGQPFFNLDNSTQNLFTLKGIDGTGRTTTGWTALDGSPPTIANNGPSGKTQSSLQIANQLAVAANESSVANIKLSTLPCSPGDRFYFETQAAVVLGGNCNLVAKYYDLNGVAITTNPNGFGNGIYQIADLANQNGRVGTEWRFISCMFIAPPTAAYVTVGARCDSTTVNLFNMEIRKS